jgi:hypothetical protein
MAVQQIAFREAKTNRKVVRNTLAGELLQCNMFNVNMYQYHLGVPNDDNLWF